METIEKVEWDFYPFSYLGFNFQSRLKSGSYEAIMAAQTGEGKFITMNMSIINSVTDISKDSTLDFVRDELARVNHGGEIAFIELAGNN